MQPERPCKWNDIRIQNLLLLSGWPITWLSKSKQSNVKIPVTYLVSRARKTIRPIQERGVMVAVVEEEKEVMDEVEVEAVVMEEAVETRMLGIIALMTGTSSTRSSVIGF
jgi:hypothetical protein